MARSTVAAKARGVPGAALAACARRAVRPGPRRPRVAPTVIAAGVPRYGSSMPAFQPADPDFERRVRQSFGRQAFSAMIGASLARVAPGEVDIDLPYGPLLTQQHGYLHGGVSTAIVDVACGYAALSLMPAGVAVLTVEFKVNLLAPGRGDRFTARGRVVKPGQAIMVCAGEVVAHRDGQERSVALMQATMMVVRDRGIVD